MLLSEEHNSPIADAVHTTVQDIYLPDAQANRCHGVNGCPEACGYSVNLRFFQGFRIHGDL